MRLRLGCRFEHEATSPTPAVVLVEPHLDAAAGIVAERWSSEPAVEATSFVDLYGNRCRRVLRDKANTAAPGGRVDLRVPGRSPELRSGCSC